MNVTHQIRLDMQQNHFHQTLHVKQGDCMSRSIEMALYNGGTAWMVPADAAILQIAYHKPDKTGGLYDTMPDGSAACSAVGNIVTARLHPQMFAVSGPVACELRLLTPDGVQISTFSWDMVVDVSVTDEIVSENYFKFATLENLQEQIGDLSGLLTADKSSLVDAVNGLLQQTIRSVNGILPENSGAVTITPENIAVQIQANQFQGTLAGMLEEIVGALAEEAGGRVLDVSAEFAVWNTDGLPLEYIKTLPDGDYRVVANAVEHLYHKVVVSDSTWVTEAQYCDDGILNIAVYKNNARLFDYESDGKVHFSGNSSGTAVTGLAVPVQDDGAATKGYVDAQINNVSAGTGFPEVDDTLSKVSKAADAAAVGKALRRLSDELDQDAVTFEDDVYMALTGKSIVSANFKTTKARPVIGGGKVWVQTTIYGEACICFFDDNGGIVGHYKSDYTYENMELTSVTLDVPDNAAYIRVSTIANAADLVRIRSLNISGEMIDLIHDAKNRTLQIDSNTARLDALYENEELAADRMDGYFINAEDGTAVANELSCVTGFIGVKPNCRYQISEAYLTYSRSICAYDENQMFILALANNTPVTSLAVTTPDNCAYLRITGMTGITPSVIPASKILNNALNDLSQQVAALYNHNTIVVKQEDFTLGYMVPSGTTVSFIYPSNGNYYHTGYIPVDENRDIKIRNYCSAGGWSVSFFDADKVRIMTAVDNTVGQLVASATVRTPFKTAYMMYSIHTSQQTTTEAVYVSAVEKDYLAHDLVNRWYAASGREIATLFQRAAKRPILTVIDDDTQSLVDVQKFHDLMTGLGVRGTYAVITGRVGSIDGMAEVLRNYEKEGFHCCLHCDSQDVFYTVADRDLAQCESDLVTGLEKMQGYGFHDPKFWVAPYGVHDEEIQSLAKKWGLYCMVSIGQKDYAGTYVQTGRFDLPRVGFNQHDRDGSSTFAELKAVMDSAAAVNGWVIVGTHMYTWDEAEGYSRFNEMVEYALNLGFEVMPLNAAFREREPIYRLYEAF